ncbi:hypothetical protein D3C81_2051650 [compost metagenome]
MISQDAQADVATALEGNAVALDVLAALQVHQRQVASRTVAAVSERQRLGRPLQVVNKLTQVVRRVRAAPLDE